MSNNMGIIYLFINKEKKYIKYGETIQELENRISQHERKTGGIADECYYFEVHEEYRFELESLIKRQLENAGFRAKKGTKEFHHIKDSKAVTQAFINVYEFYKQLLEYSKQQIIKKNKIRCNHCKIKLNFDSTIFDKYCNKCNINFMIVNSMFE